MRSSFGRRTSAKLTTPAALHLGDRRRRWHGVVLLWRRGAHPPPRPLRPRRTSRCTFRTRPKRHEPTAAPFCCLTAFATSATARSTSCSTTSGRIRLLSRVSTLRPCKAMVERRFSKTRSDRSGAPDSMVVVADGKVHTGSDAALILARHLRSPWRWLALLWIVPRPLRDTVYRWVARNRYRWFGESETCRVPTPELRSRFL